MTYQPFLNDPERISALDRQRFVVLRAPSNVNATFAEVRHAVRQQLDGAAISYPAMPHVTLCGFAAGVSLHAVQQLVASWASTVPPLRIEVMRVSSFPQPFQIVIVEIRKTPDLFSALSTLRARAEQERLAVSTVMPVDKWTFHMTVANCDKLNAADWSRVVQFVEKTDVPVVGAEVGAAEIVAFDEGAEYSGGVYSFEAGAR